MTGNPRLRWGEYRPSTVDSEPLENLAAKALVGPRDAQTPMPAAGSAAYGNYSELNGSSVATDNPAQRLTDGSGRFRVQSR